MNNSVEDLLHCHHQIQDDITHELWLLKSQRDHANDSLINDIPTCDGNSSSILTGI